MNKKKSLEIISILRQVIPNPVCELNFTNEFELLCAVMLSAQTTDKRVNMVTPVLFQKYPTPEKLMSASVEEVYPIVKSLGFSTKAKNLIAMSRVLHETYHDVVPKTMEELTRLPGVGRKTANVVMAVGYHIPSMPVDTHLHRMAIRLGYVKEDADVLECEQAYCKYLPKETWIEAHHLFLLFGRYYCKAQRPLCENCPLSEYCVFVLKKKHV